MRPTVYLLCWSGSPETAQREVRFRYRDCTVSVLNQREFREKGSRGQFRVLRGLRGQAVIFFFASRNEIRMPQVLAWTGLIHRCRETVLATPTEWESFRRVDWVKMLPKTLLSGIRDIFVLCYTWLLLWLLPTSPVSIDTNRTATLDVAYLYPFPLDSAKVGGAMSHVHGFLGGLARVGGACQVYSARPLPTANFATRVIENESRFYLFSELLTLGFNLPFAWRVQSELKTRSPRALYQRHGRFVIAGALLSRWLRVPLVLEFNGSEVWTAKFWDPTRFRSWLSLCEDFSLASASVILVVSEALRDELVMRGVSPARILVNPNGVDVDRFCPNCGGEYVRGQLGIKDRDVVAGFVGTFSYWHGVDVLQAVMLKTLDATQDPVLSRVKFLLIGQGPLFADLKTAVLKHPRAQGRVIFCGSVEHDRVPAYLDAADILLSPHVPMQDGRPFFGSPTKLFEYMAMSKGIVASRLEQLATVLDDNESALLVTPADADEFLAAMRRLAADPGLRTRLGVRAREIAGSRHTWSKHAAQVLKRLNAAATTDEPEADTAESPISVAPREI